MDSFMKYLVVIMAIVAHILILTQLRFEVWPEMLVMPYLQQNGFELYRDMIVPWTPGLMWILHSWFNLVGLSVGGLKLFTWMLIAGIDFLVFFIAKKRWGEKAGLAALTFFVLLQPVFDGNGLWFDLAAAPFLLLAFYWRQPLFLGPAFLIKQSVVWLFPLVLLTSEKYQILLKLKYLIVGMVGAISLSLLWFWARGTAGDYWRWAYDFAFTKLPAMPGHRDLGNWQLWILSVFPFISVAILRRQSLVNKALPLNSLDPFWWAVLSIPFALPRFGLFHFQPAAAFLSLAAGQLYKNYKDYKSYKTYFIFGLAAIYLIFFWQRVISFQWQKPDRFLEPEVYQLAAKVALETKKDEPVLVVNGPELVYVLADRLPPKPWLTQFPWFLELPGFQEELINKFKQQDLSQVFMTPYKNEGEFTPGSYQPKILLNYIQNMPNDSNH